MFHVQFPKTELQSYVMTPGGHSSKCGTLNENYLNLHYYIVKQAEPRKLEVHPS
jgi:hypothetical protein